MNEQEEKRCIDLLWGGDELKTMNRSQYETVMRMYSEAIRRGIKETLEKNFEIDRVLKVALCIIKHAPPTGAWNFPLRID